jgi:hypothetical protein
MPSNWSQVEGTSGQERFYDRCNGIVYEEACGGEKRERKAKRIFLARVRVAESEKSGSFRKRAVLSPNAELPRCPQCREEPIPSNL